MAKKTVQTTQITVIKQNDDDYISLTDMARSQLQEHIIFRWFSLKSTIEYLGEWDILYNPHFHYTEFGTILNMTGHHNFVRLNQIAIHQMPYRRTTKIDTC